MDIARINLNNIILSAHAKIIRHHNKLIIGNINGNGKWIKIPSCYVDYVIGFLGTENGFDDLMQSVGNEQEKSFYIDLLYKLREIGVLEKKDVIKDHHIKSVSLELTTDCNLRCKHCSSDYGNKEIINMSAENILKIIRWANQHHTESVTLTGGEIFCLKDIADKLTLIRNHFKGNISIITNGTLIDDKMAELIRKNIDKVYISLDGYDSKSVAAIRGKHVFEQVMQSVELLHKENISAISLSMVLTSENKNNLDRFKDLCASIGVEPMPRILTVRGRALKNYDSLVWEREKGTEDNVLKNPNMVSVCTAGTDNLSVNADGTIHLCSALEDSNFAISTLDSLEHLDHVLRKMRSMCVVDTVDTCKECIVRYFCSSACQAINYHIYTNRDLRERRCQRNKKELMERVWNVKI